MSDQIIINITPDPSINISAVDNNEEIDLNAITLNQGLINHSVTHQSGGSDALAHNLLGGLNGGQSSEYYHLTQNQYDNAVYRYDLPVYQTGDQTISGVKTFIDRPTVNGIGVLLSGEGGGGSVSGDYLPISGGTLTGDLSVQGDINVTDFVSAPVYNLSLNDVDITSESSVKTWARLPYQNYPYYPGAYYFGGISNRGIYFSDDGLLLYVLDSISGPRLLYTVELNVPWVIPEDDGSDYTIHIKDITSQISSPLGLHFSPDGTKLFIAGLNGTNKILLKYNLLIPWDVSSTSETPDQTLDLTTPTGMSGITDPRYVYFKPDGSKFFVANRSTNGSLSILWEVSLSTNWDISIGSVVSTVSRNIDPDYQSFASQSALTFTADGKKMIIVARTVSIATYYLIEYTLTTQWSIANGWATPYIRSVPSLFYQPSDATDANTTLPYLYYNSSVGKAFFANVNYTNISELNFTDNAVSVDNLIVNGSISADYYGNVTANDIVSDTIYTNNTIFALNGISTLGNLQINTNTSSLVFGGTARMYGESAGIIRMTDIPATGFNRLIFGGTTTSFPSIKRNGSGIDIRNAADTAFTALRAADITASGIVGATSFAFSPSGSRITSSQNGIVALTNDSGNDFGRLQFGGITPSYPSIVRNGSGIDIRDAANTKFTPLRASDITASNNIYASGTVSGSNLVYNILNQDISGIKNFISQPQYNNNALSTEIFSIAMAIALS